MPVLRWHDPPAALRRAIVAVLFNKSATGVQGIKFIVNINSELSNHGNGIFRESIQGCLGALI